MLAKDLPQRFETVDDVVVELRDVRAHLGRYL
jgi:hypothetical protein